MKNPELERKIAQLETLNDQLVSELKYIDGILKEIGFPDGIVTLKIAATEIRELQSKEPPPHPPES